MQLPKGGERASIIVDPKGINALDTNCCVDSIFAGMWDSDDHADPDLVHSRIGHIISDAGCPVTWLGRANGGDIKVRKVNPDKNLSNIMAKGLGGNAFKRIHKLLLGF
eukprot:4314054-Ditylum_brightwellii.AAC.1